jgi:hypothetical protein
MRRTIIILASISFLLTLAGTAQERRSEISMQGTGFFTKSSSGNGTAYSTTETGGFLGTYRYHLNRWISAEGAYGYHTNTQKYLFSSSEFRIQSGIHQMTASLVVNLPSRASSRFNPYTLAGGGALVFDPTSSSTLCRERSRKPSPCSFMEWVSTTPFANRSRSAPSTEVWSTVRPTSGLAR